MEFYRRCLIQIFGILEEYEVGTEGQRTLLGRLPKEEELLPATSESENRSVDEQKVQRLVEEVEETPLLQTHEEEMEDNKAVIREEVEVMEDHQDQAEPLPRQASKYDKLPIKVEESGEEWEEVEERWAKLSRPNGFISGLLHWKAGGGDSTAHIQTHFEPRTGSSAPPQQLERTEGDRGTSPESQEGEGGEGTKLPDGEDVDGQQGKVTFSSE